MVTGKEEKRRKWFLWNEKKEEGKEKKRKKKEKKENEMSGQDSSLKIRKDNKIMQLPKYP